MDSESSDRSELPGVTYSTLVQGGARLKAPSQVEIHTAAGSLTAGINSATWGRRLKAVSSVGFEYESQRPDELDGSPALVKLAIYPGTDRNRKQPTALHFTSFGTQTRQVIADPLFHCRAAGWIADFWLPFLDRKQGGCFANILNGGVRDPGAIGEDKWSYLTSRAVAGFSFAFQLTGDLRYLDAARHCYCFLVERSIESHAGLPFFRSRQQADGSPHPLSAGFINIFVQEYCFTGPLRLLAATGDPAVAQFIRTMCEGLMRFHDPSEGGFYDALAPDTALPRAGETDTKSFTSSADLMAAAVLFSHETDIATEQYTPARILRDLSAIIIRRHLAPGRPFIIESLNRDWTANSSSWRNEYATPDIAGNIGATAKVARVLAGSLHVLPEAERAEARSYVRTILDGLFSVGAYDPLRGGVFDVMKRDSCAGQQAEFVYHADYVWWSQQQLSQAAYLGYLYFKDRAYLEAARAIMRFWIGAFMAPQGGVHDTVDHAGNPVSTHMGRYVKCLYHELEYPYFAALFEAIINGAPLTLYFAPGYSGDPRRALPSYHGLTWRVDSVEVQARAVRKVTFSSSFHSEA